MLSKCLLVFMLSLNTMLSMKKEVFKSCYVIEYESGDVLYEYSPYQHYDPKDLTQLMSLILIYEAIEQHVFSLEDLILLDENDIYKGDKSFSLQAHDCMPVQELILCILHKNSYDAILTLANRITGSHEQFVEHMNLKAQELGCKDTLFQNAYGLYHQNHYSCAKDLTIIAAYLLKLGGEDFIRLSQVKEMTLSDQLQQWMISDQVLLKQYQGGNGLKKTLHSNGQYSMVLTSSLKGVRVVMTGFYASDLIAMHTQINEMLKEIFNNYKNITLVKKDAYQNEIEVIQGHQNTLIYHHDAFSRTILKNESLNIQSITYQFNPLCAPISKGQIVGKMMIELSNHEVYEVELYSKEEIRHQSFIRTFYQNLLANFS